VKFNFKNFLLFINIALNIKLQNLFFFKEEYNIFKFYY